MVKNIAKSAVGQLVFLVFAESEAAATTLKKRWLFFRKNLLHEAC